MITGHKLQQATRRRSTTRRTSTGAVLVWAIAGAAGPALAQSADADVKRYCANIAKAASEARFKWQTERLDALEARISDKARELDAKTATLRDWMAQREAIEKKAAEKLVGIYAKMRPEIAATQIAQLDDEMAAAILGQLNARQASAIFNEIAPERAGKLAALIAGKRNTESRAPAVEKTAAADKGP